MSTDTACIFCKIIAGQSPAHILHRDERCFSFLDIAPVNRGHPLVVPLRHHDDIFSISVDELGAIVARSQQLATVIKSLCEADGIGIHQLNGAASGQTVFHYHMHVIPAYEGRAPRIHGRQLADQAELKTMATQIRRQLTAE